jgi:hypothetical protein
MGVSAFGESASAVRAVADASSHRPQAAARRGVLRPTFHSGLLHTAAAPTTLTGRCATSRTFSAFSGACDGISRDTRSPFRIEDGYGGTLLAARPQPYGS